MLFEIKDTKRLPMGGALQVGPDMVRNGRYKTAPNSAENE